jgi:hypothetical protein
MGGPRWVKSSRQGSAALVKQLVLPAGKQREAYHTKGIFTGFGYRKPYQTGSFYLQKLCHGFFVR